MAPSPRSHGYYQCDRQCRAAHGFHNRNISGRRRQHPAILGVFQFPTHKCDCFEHGAPIGDAPHVHRRTPVVTSAGAFNNAKPSDSDHWCRPFASPYVCVLGSEHARKPTTMTRGDFTTRPERDRGAVVLHCGKCGACSTMADVKVLWETQRVATAETTRCSTAFALSNMAGFRKQSLADLRQCLAEAGLGFSDDGEAWAQPAGMPTCMDCWVDNILSDTVLCAGHCWKRLLFPDGGGTAALNYTTDACLQCDELSSQPDFVRCAGATQRSVGITGDIARGPNEACGLGACAGKDADCFDSAPLRYNATSTTSGPAGWPWMCNAALVAFFLFVLQGTMLDD